MPLFRVPDPAALLAMYLPVYLLHQQWQRLSHKHHLPHFPIFFARYLTLIAPLQYQHIEPQSLRRFHFPLLSISPTMPPFSQTKTIDTILYLPNLPCPLLHCFKKQHKWVQHHQTHHFSVAWVCQYHLPVAKISTAINET